MHKLVWVMCIFIGLNLAAEPITVAVTDIEVKGFFARCCKIAC